MTRARCAFYFIAALSAFRACLACEPSEDAARITRQAQIASSMPPRPACPEPDERTRLFEIELIGGINMLRRNGTDCARGSELPGARPVIESRALTCAARAHAAAMAERGFFSHIDPDERTPTDRARAFGFAASVAENLAWGKKTPKEVTEQWRHSSDHCNTLMDGRYDFIGAGYALGSNDKTFWAVILGVGGDERAAQRPTQVP
jgi:uncharacterized protein YkwD